MKKADLLALSQFHPGDRVRLTDGVLHKEYAGMIGTVKQTIKSRRLVRVEFSREADGRERTWTYDAYPENVEAV